MIISIILFATPFIVFLMWYYFIPASLLNGKNIEPSHKDETSDILKKDIFNKKFGTYETMRYKK